MKSHSVKSIPAVAIVSEYLKQGKGIPLGIKTEIINVLEGVEKLDGEVKQKDQLLSQKDSVINQKTLEVQSKDNLLVQKEQKLQETITDRVQKEFAEVIHKLQPDLHYGTAEDFQIYIQGKLIIESKNYALMQNDLTFYKEKLLIKEFTEVLNRLHPDEYPTKNPNDWKGDYGKQAIESKNYALMQNDLPIFKQDLLMKELIDVLHKLYPSEYPTKNPDDWKDSWGKRVIDSKNYEVIEDKLPTFKKLLLSQIENVLNSKDQLLVVKDNETESLRNLLLQKEVETQKILVQRELEKKELLTQKELEKEELIIQKEREKEELIAQRDKEVKQLEKVSNDVLIKEFIEILPQRYPDLYPNNFAEWSNDIWGKQIVDGNDIEAIKHYLPIYRKEVIENLNQSILAERTRIEELLVEKANIQQKLIDKDNLLSDQTEDIEKINVLLETKKIIIQRLEQEKEILQTRHDILDMKMQLTVKEFTVREREKDKALLEKDNELKKLAESSKLLVDYKEEMLKFKELCKTKEAEIKEKDELLVQKEIEKAVLVDDLQEKLHLKDSEILGLKMMVSEMDLAGDYQLEHLND